MGLPIPPLELLLAALLVALGSFLQGALGFGLAIFAAPPLFLIDPAFIPGPVLFVAMVISVIIVWRNRAGLALGELGSAAIGRMPGMAVAFWLLAAAAQWLLSLVLGAAVLLGVVVSLLPGDIRPTRNRLLVAGFLSGFMGTATSVGGPPMALLYQHARGPHIRANLGGYFLFGSTVSLAGMALLGHFGRAELALALAVTPGALAGVLLSGRVHRWVDAGRIRPALLALCALSA
ncbi:sulfite exporter TauE/SafE family protein, partial [Halorhodospira neutriphila]